MAMRVRPITEKLMLMMKVDRFEPYTKAKATMDGKYIEIPNLSSKELRSLLKRAQRSYKSLFFVREELCWRVYHPTERKDNETWSSLNYKIRKIERSMTKIRFFIKRIRYWLGKRRALKCPAFHHKKSREVRCRIYKMLNYLRWDKTESHQELFTKYCSCCKLSIKERLKRTQWEIILRE